MPSKRLVTVLVFLPFCVQAFPPDGMNKKRFRMKKAYLYYFTAVLFYHK